MIEKDTFEFLAELKDNNYREWFDEHRHRYQSAKLNIQHLIDHLIEKIIQFDEGVRGTTAQKSVFRIFRDVRFSKNKAPYKTNMGAWIAPGGRKSPFAGYYVHVEPRGKSFLAGGVYRPASNVLKAIREGIDYDASSLRGILGEKKFVEEFGELKGDKLKTAPKGYPKDHPDIDLIRHKDYIVSKPLQDSEVMASDFIENAAKTFEVLFSLNQYLNQAIGEIEN